MEQIGADELTNITLDLTKPTVLFSAEGHTIYWLGITNETAFRCNTYLIQDGDEVILVDPGNRLFFDQVKERVAQIIDPDLVTGMILCHQDPDVAASIYDWLTLKPSIKIFTSPRANVLLPHYGVSDYDYYDIAEKPTFVLPSGKKLEFILAPFLHSPAAFTTYDDASHYLFSGDIWAALDINWSLIVKDFDQHVDKMNLFNIDYMASNLATRGFVAKIKRRVIDAILPQHGSIITKNDVPVALEYLEKLQCGTDIVYADLETLL